MFSTLFQDPLLFILSVLALIVTITIHEFSHAWMANRLGDPTPKLQGRLSLNPLKHLDPLGTVALLIAGFGWGKPVEFDGYNLRNPRKDAAYIALAGPASNILLVFASVVLLKIFQIVVPIIHIEFITSFMFFVSLFLFSVIRMSIALAIFNCIPIHPLDGGKVLIGFLPKHLAYEWDMLLHKYGMIVLFLLIVPFGGQSPVDALISPIINALFAVVLTILK